MKPTQILSDEHRVIEVMLTVLEKMVDQSEEAGRLNKEDADQAVAFIRTFADTCHHGKEEGQLFPAMIDKGIPLEQGPIGVMLHEHELGRAHVKLMAESIDAASQGDADALETFAEHAMGYVYLLRAHIQKEDTILFPMAARLLNSQEEAGLLAQFDVVEHDHIGAGTHEHFLNVAETLATKYGVSTERISAHRSTGTCGCSHTASGH